MEIVIKRFIYDVSVSLELKRATVEHLIDMSRMHYDATCRFASSTGGFIYGWKNALGSHDAVTVTASHQEIDLVCKILEAEGWVSKREDYYHARFVALMKSMSDAYLRQNE